MRFGCTSERSYYCSLSSHPKATVRANELTNERSRRGQAIVKLTRRSALGYPQDEGGAFIVFALYFDLTTVGPGNLARYAETKPRPVFGAGRICSVETFEHERELIGPYPDTIVRDLEPGPAVLLPHAHRNGSPFWRVLDRVIQKDVGYLANPGTVEGSLDQPS